MPNRNYPVTITTTDELRRSDETLFVVTIRYKYKNFREAYYGVDAATAVQYALTEFVENLAGEASVDEIDRITVEVGHDA